MRRVLFRLALGVVWWLAGVCAFAQINTDYVMMMGRNALYYEDYVLSIQRFNMVINSKPFLSEPYYYRGLAKFYLEDYVGAEQDLNRAVERNPYLEYYYELRGLCRVNQNKLDAAEQDYRKVTELNPMNEGSWHNMALCQIEQENYERADSTLDRMIRQWPRRTENFQMKSQISFARADTVQALEWLDRILEEDSYNGQAWAMKGQVSLSRGQYQEAEQQLNKAIVQMPRNAGLFVNRALARFQLNNLRGTMSDYDVALEIEPGNYLAHFNRGLLRAQVGEDNLAIQDFDFVLEQEPDNVMALYNRALLLDNTGDYKGALRDISLVLKEYPEFWSGYQMRASIRRKVGDVYGAERDEFAVLKANMEKRTGTYRPRTRATRKKEEVDPGKYDRLVVEDTPATGEQPQYVSEYRGRVQERSVALTPMPVYVFSYYKKGASVSGFVAYHPTLDILNGKLPSRLQLTNQEGPVSEQNLERHFANIRVLTNRIARGSHVEDSHLQRAVEYYHVRDFESAMDDLDTLIQLRPTEAELFFLRAQCRLGQTMAGRQSFGEDKPRGGEADAMALRMVRRDLEQTVRLAPDMAYAYYDLGNVFFMEGSYQQAEEAFSDALKHLPHFPDAYYNRGVTYLMMGQTDKGISDLSQAGELGLYSAYSLIKQHSKANAK